MMAGALRAAAPVLATLVASAAAANIVTLAELNSEIDKQGGNKKVAFLTKANHDSVKTVLSSNAQVVICDGSDTDFPSCDSTAELIGLIRDDSVLAGLISGLPDADSAPHLNAFSSTVVSLRAMLMAPVFSSETPHGTLGETKSSKDLSLAVDAVIVTLQSSGIDSQVAHRNMPFEFIEAHTCKIDDPSLYVVPNFAAASGLLRTTLDNKILKIGAVGPADWSNDGNYMVDPPTGFYPDWVSEFCKGFNALKGPDGVRYDSAGTITCQRTFQPSSAKVFKDLFEGTTYVSEPYYVVDSFYWGTNEACSSSADCRQANLPGEKEYCQDSDGNDSGNDKTCKHPASPRFKHVRQSCSTFGIDSTFMTKKTIVPGDDRPAVVLDDAAYTVIGLNSAIQRGVNKKVGFLSQANYATVQTVLDDSVQVVVCDGNDPTYAACVGTDGLIQHVLDGTLVAGVISGLPEAKYEPHLNIFSSTVVSMRAMFMAPVYSTEMVHGTTLDSKSSEDLSLAVDAAIVRVQAAGKDEIAKKNNMPFEFIALHTCKSQDPSLFVVPNSASATGLLRTALDEKNFKIGALGQYDWAQDGNYLVDPPTGFYPDWVTAFCEEFNSLAGPDGVRYDAAGTIQCTRVYQPSSAAVFKDLFEGVSYATEPYYTVDATYTGTKEDCQADADCRKADVPTGLETCDTSKCTHPSSPRTRHFRMSCSTLGIDTTIMVAKNFTLVTEEFDEASGAAPAASWWRRLGALLMLLVSTRSW